jgi:hypothetical protein
VSANCTGKLQTCPLVREGAEQREDRKCPTVIQIWSYAPDGGPTPRRTERRSQDNFYFALNTHATIEELLGASFSKWSMWSFCCCNFPIYLQSVTIHSANGVLGSEGVWRSAL